VRGDGRRWPPPAVNDTRSTLLRTAEQLFAARGVDTVSLREISRESGSRNAMATQYHFGDRTGVVRAIMQKHQPAVEAARQALLDQFEAGGTAKVRDLAGALVRPLAAKLADRDGGREFLQIYAEILDRDPGLAGSWPSITRWRALVDPLLEPEAVRLHRRYTAMVHSAVELGRRARARPHRDDRLFTSYLVDVVTAILSAPVSDETRRLAAERDRAVTPRKAQRTATPRSTRQSRPA
jgi:AcrR family transcriptional regulator